MKVDIDVGKDRLSVEVPEANVITAARAETPAPPVIDIAAAVRQALESPLHFPALRQALTPDAERRPDFTRAVKLPPQRSHIFDVLMTVQLDGMEVEQGRDVRNHTERRVPEYADREYSGPPCGSGQRRRLLGRDVAGAAGHEHKARERRRPGGAHVCAAIETADLGATEDELAGRLRRIAGTHERGADEEPVDVA